MKRVQLTWSRNKSEDVKAYRVFRSIKKDVSRRDMMVMEVEHPSLPAPIEIVEDRLAKGDSGYYESRYHNLMPDENVYPITVTLNGIDIRSLGISLDVVHQDGIFLFSMEIGESDELLATYYIDGIRVLDTDEIEQEGVNYLGPIARDRSENTIPVNLTLMPDHERGCIVLKWGQVATAGQRYYYRVESIDEFGNFSELSLEDSALLHEGLAYEGYLIERSYDGEEWGIISSQGAEEYIEYGIDRDAPSPVQSLEGDWAPNPELSSANVSLSWGEPAPDTASVSPMYRVRSVSMTGGASLPSEVVGPVYLSSVIDRYVIRRKVYDGSIPTYSGADATTVGVVDGANLQFTDENVTHLTDYTYAVYAVDRAENVSMAMAIMITIGDATL